MYGLKKESILAYKQLVKHLKIHEYYPVIGTNAIYPHKTRKTRFCLCVDDFGRKYCSTDDADYIINASREKYATATDWEGKNFCG